jgi:hypothetical protein
MGGATRFCKWANTRASLFLSTKAVALPITVTSTVAAGRESLAYPVIVITDIFLRFNPGLQIPIEPLSSM